MHGEIAAVEPANVARERGIDHVADQLQGDDDEYPDGDTEGGKE